MQTLSSQLQALMGGGSFGATVFVRVSLQSGLYCVSDAGDSFTWNANLYLGLDRALQVQVPPTTSISRGSSSGAGATITLSASDPGVLSTFFEEPYRKAPVLIGVLLKDLTTGAYVAEVPCYPGFIDTAEVNITEAVVEEPGRIQVANLKVTLAPRSVRLDRVGVRTRSDADQRAHRDANDGFFKDVGVAAKSQINWGKSGPNSPAATRPGSAAGGFSPQDIANQLAQSLF